MINKEIICRNEQGQFHNPHGPAFIRKGKVVYMLNHITTNIVGPALSLTINDELYAYYHINDHRII